MSASGGQSKIVWKWNQWSTVLVAVGVLVFLLVLTANGPLWLGLMLGLAVAIIGGVGFGFVPRNPPAAKIHGTGSIPGAARRAARARKAKAAEAKRSAKE